MAEEGEGGAAAREEGVAGRRRKIQVNIKHSGGYSWARVTLSPHELPRGLLGPELVRGLSWPPPGPRVIIFKLYFLGFRETSLDKHYT